MRTKNVPIRFDEKEHKELKIFCVQHGVSMQEFVINAIREKKQKWAV